MSADRVERPVRMTDAAGCRREEHSLAVPTSCLVATVTGIAVAGGWTARHSCAPSVRRWRRSAAPTMTAGRLHTRVLGAGQPAMVLLHGIVGCGDYYGESYDVLAAGRRLVVPDLLGFGDSYRAAAPTGYGLEAHLDALDEMAGSLDLVGPLTVVGHSMGAVLALHWAHRRRAQVQRVVALSAPLYNSVDEGMSHIRGLGWLEATMALDTPAARAACAWMCRHRTAAGWLAVGLKPHLPVPVARRAALHTWLAYQASMQQVVLTSRWQRALVGLNEARVPVQLAAGAHDPVPVAGRAQQLADRYPMVTSGSHPTADHDLPLAEPDWCRHLLETTD